MIPRVVVIDTNVVISGLITSDSAAPTARILDGMLEGCFPFLLSGELLSEYWRVPRRTAIRRLHSLSDQELESLLTAVVVNAIFREAPATTEKAPSREDQHLWDLLATEPGAVLVTGDRALLESRKRRSVISPASFLRLLDSR